jgi:hypothetical protein
MLPPESESHAPASTSDARPAAHSPAQVPARLNAASFCGECDTEILNVPAGGNCPSCNTPVILSDFVRGPLTALPRATLKAMESGARLVGTAVLLWIGATLILAYSGLTWARDPFGRADEGTLIIGGGLWIGAFLTLSVGFRRTAIAPPGLPRLARDAARRDVRHLGTYGLVFTLLLGGVVYVLAMWSVIATMLLDVSGLTLPIIGITIVTVQAVLVALGAARWLRYARAIGERCRNHALACSDSTRRAVGALIVGPFVALGATFALSSFGLVGIESAGSALTLACVFVVALHGPAMFIIVRTAIKLRRSLAEARALAPERVDYPGMLDRDAWREARLFGLGPLERASSTPPRPTCSVCEYDLTGLAPDAPCPECSTSATLAHARPRILSTEPATLLQARTGFILMGWAWLGTGAMYIAHALTEAFYWSWNPPSWIWWLRSAGVTVFGIAASLGLWRAALVIPASRDLSVRALHISARLCAIIAVPALTIGWLSMFANALPTFGAVTGALRHLYVVWFVWFWIAMPLVCRRAARRAEARKLYRRSSWAAFIAVFWIGSMHGVLYTLIAIGIVGSTPWTWQLWALSGWIVNPLYLITGLIALRLAHRLRVAASVAADLRAAPASAPPAT